MIYFAAVLEMQAFAERVSSYCSETAAVPEPEPDSEPVRYFAEVFRIEEVAQFDLLAYDANLDSVSSQLRSFEE